MSENGDDSQQGKLNHQETVEELNKKLKEQAERLKFAEERLKQISDYMLDMIAIADTRTKIVYASPSCKKFMGYAPEEIVGKSIFELMHPDDVDRAKDGIREAVEKKEGGRIEYRYRHKDGRYVWLETVGNFLFDESGNISGAIFSSRDISDRKLAEQALIESERRFKDISCSMADFIWETDMDAAYTYCSGNVEDVTGYSADELMGKTPFDFMHPDDAERAREAFNEAILRKQPIKDIEIRSIKKDGKVTWLLTSGVPIIEESGAVKGYRGVAKDITDRKRVERVLRETSQFNSQIISSAHEGIAVYDHDLNYLVWNNFMEELTGVPAKKVLGKNALKLFPHLREQGVYSLLRRALEGKIVHSSDMPFHMPYTGKSGWVSGIYAPHRNAKGEITGVIEMVRDITKRKQAEEALKESEEKFRKLAETAAAAIFIHKGGKFYYVNSFIESITGYTRDELLTMDFWNIVHPDFRELVRQRGIARSRGEEIVSRYEFKIVTKSGEERWVDFTGDIIDYEGEPVVLGTAYDITERKRAEEALKMSEETYKFLFDNSPSINIVIGTDGKVKDVNKLVEKTGYTKDELIGRDVLDFVVPEKRGKVLEAILEALKGKDTPEIDVDVISKDGSIRTLLISRGQAPLYKDGKLDGILITGMDITNTRLVEESIVRAKQEWERTFDSVPDLIMILDKQFRIMRVNKSMVNKLKASPTELIGRVCYEVVHQTDEPPPYCPHKKSLASGKEHSEEMFLGTLGGYYSIIVSPIYDPDGNIPGSVHVARDITERKEAEDAIKSKLELENTLLRVSSRFVGAADLDKAINESLADIGRLAGADRAYVFIFNDDGKTMNNTYEWCAKDVNPQIQRLRDLPVEKFSWWNEKIRRGEVIDVKDVSTLPKEAGAEREEFEKEGIRSILGIPLYAGGNLAGFVGFDNVKGTDSWSGGQLMLLRFTADIFGSAFERRRAENEKVKLEGELLQSQKMEALGRLAGGIAHDFNNLLTGIIGYSQMLMTSINPLDPLRGDIDEIKKAAERGASLTKQLLTFSRKQPVTPKVINLNEIISNYKNILSRIIGEDIDLIFIPSKNLGNIKVDQSQFEQVLINLVINSRDAMPHGGRLIIDTKNATIDEEFCRHHPYATVGEYVSLSVSDTGVGMDEEVKKHIFEPFFTTKEFGTGLGLAIVYGIVKQNGGFIDVASETGAGTTFKIYLPRVYEKTVKAKPSKERRVSGKETILLVEDENMLRDLVKKVLQTHGYRVLEAKSSRQALQLFEKNRNKIRLLIVDVIIPGMSGWELFEKLKAKKSRLKVLFTSGYTEEIIGQPTASERGVPFIQKPFTIDELLKKVREAIET